MCKIAVVDDYSDSREQMCAQLRRLFPEHSPIGFDTSEESLEQFKNTSNIDILFFDSLKAMDTRDGATFATALRAKNPNVMLIYMSPIDKHENLDNMNKLSKLGIDGYMKIPASDEMLQVMVVNALNRVNLLNNHVYKEDGAVAKAVDSFVEKLDALALEISRPKKRRLFGAL